MSASYFFYDLETSGLDPRTDRIMQFAGVRTDADFQPIGEPINEFICLNDDTLPNPEALLITGITPQQTVELGYTEAEFASMVVHDIFTPETTVIGFNNIRFDDEFVRHLLWRNFFDPYEWCWKDGRSRWDMLDVVRMTRALRPTGIEWPVDETGSPTNRLEHLAKANGIDHIKAHDALSDVQALIGVTKLIHDVHPDLFTYLYAHRDKRAVQDVLNLEKRTPAVFTGGHLPSEYQKTSVIFPLALGANGTLIVYDLRYDPTEFLNMDEAELAKRAFASYQERQKDTFTPFPVYELYYNRAPAIAPLGVLQQEDAWARIGLNVTQVEAHKTILLQAPQFAQRVRDVFVGRSPFAPSQDPEGQLYDGFLNERDKSRVQAVRNASKNELKEFHPHFDDARLIQLFLHYKARNFPETLSQDEVRQWEAWRVAHLERSSAAYFKALDRLSKQELSDSQQFILQELQLWLESIAPTDISDQDSA